MFIKHSDVNKNILIHKAVDADLKVKRGEGKEGGGRGRGWGKGGGGGKGVSLGGGFQNSYPAAIIFSVPSPISTKLIYSICHYM